nr:CoA transferase [Pseudomonas sp.]
VPLAASLYAGTRGGGQYWQVSVLEACITLAELQATEAIAAGTPQMRQGLNRYASTFPLGIYRCREGWLGITVLTPAQWDTFCELLGLADLKDDPRLQVGAGRLQHADFFDERVSPLFLERTAQEWFEQGLALRLPFVPVPDTGELLRSERFRQRGMLAGFDVAGRCLEAPGLPWGLTRTPSQAGGIVPELNEGAALWQTLDAGSDAPRQNGSAPGHNAFTTENAQDTSPDGGMPLASIRVVDLSMGWAGPLCTRQLADLGADVIKIESCGYADWWRGVSSNQQDFEQRLYEKSARFGMMNRNKRGITLDLTSAEGARLVKELVKDADVVVENYSNGVLRKLGLDYAELCRIRPDLIMVSMSAFGAGGKVSECRAYGSTLEQGSGLPSVSGRPNDPPVMNHQAYGDAVGGLNGACSVLVALLHRQQTGEGQHIDMSQIECMLPYVATWVIAHSANGQAPERLGNRHPDYAPHGIYRCTGQDSWLMVAATDDAMWRALCKAIGQPGLANDPAFDTADKRRRHADQIDVLIQGWTLRHGCDEAMFALQAAGVAAGADRTPGRTAPAPHRR